MATPARPNDAAAAAGAAGAAANYQHPMKETLWTTTGRAADFWPEIARAGNARTRRHFRKRFPKQVSDYPTPLFRIRYARRTQP